jgi:elongation factor 2
MYESKFKIDKKILIEKLWGDNFYDAKKKKWVTTDVDDEGKKLQRGFVQFIMDPIIKLMRNIM